MAKKIQYEICRTCKHRNNISYKQEIGDYDESWREGYILIYCDECGSQIEIRVK